MLKHASAKTTRQLDADIAGVPEILARSHLPSLDGLRAISIVMVIVAHINIFYKIRFVTAAFSGELGVNIFFVISGFLITTLLLKERTKSGTVSLKKFYIRRFLRIVPVAYLYLFVLLLGIKYFGLPILYSSIVGSAIFLRNFSIGLFPWNAFVNHYWSLSVEEQFYLMFPSLIKRKRNGGIYVVLGFLFLIIVIKIAASYSSALQNGKLRYIFEFFSHLDGITVGCLAAMVLFKKIIAVKRRPRFLLLKKILAGSAIYYMHSNLLNIPFGLHTVLSSCLIAIFIVLNLIDSPDIVYRLLNSKAFIHVGMLSYSLYIWQELYIGLLANRYTELQEGDIFLSLSFIPEYLALTYFTALVSYFLYEKRFLRLKERFNQKAKHNKQVLEAEEVPLSASASFGRIV